MKSILLQLRGIYRDSFDYYYRRRSGCLSLSVFEFAQVFEFHYRNPKNIGASWDEEAIPASNSFLLNIDLDGEKSKSMLANFPCNRIVDTMSSILRQGFLQRKFKKKRK
jgi:hypothetical protein